MNCAPVIITGGSSKRDEDELETRNATQLMERDSAAFNALPNMFVANVGNGCATIDSQDTAYPDPGDSLEQLGLSTLKPVAPSGAGCGSPVAQASGSASTGGAIASTVPTSAPIASSQAVATVPGGVFATTAVAPAASTPAASTSATPAANTPASGGSSSGGSSSGSTMSSGAAMAGACTNEGAWNCISGGTSFQRCASGSWSVAMPVAAGTTCTSAGIMRKRDFHA
jgi:hypothetical protein